VFKVADRNTSLYDVDKVILLCQQAVNIASEVSRGGYSRWTPGYSSHKSGHAVRLWMTGSKRHLIHRSLMGTSSSQLGPRGQES
jgi:hypothetical protein